MQLIILQRSVNRQNFQPYAAKNFAANAANAANAATSDVKLNMGCFYGRDRFDNSPRGNQIKNAKKKPSASI